MSERFVGVVCLWVITTLVWNVSVRCFALIGETFHLRIVLFELWLCECFCQWFCVGSFWRTLCGALWVVFFFLGDDEIWVVVFKVVL